MEGPVGARIYAHSLQDRPVAEWEPLTRHLAAVAERAAGFAAPFGWAEAARLAGRLHDIGKLSPAFQAYIRGERPSGGDHSSAGARIALDRYPGGIGALVAAIVGAHHAGLADGVDFEQRMADAARLVPAGWEAVTGELPALQGLAGRRIARNPAKGFKASFLYRMLFSCLVDADFLETERFYAEAKREPVDRGGHLPLAELRDRLAVFMADKRGRAKATPLNALRAEILDHAIAKAALDPGLFTLTVPTGGGKTLASLSFALEHAVRHGLRRVIYVIPFTSIIEQTAAVFRDALGTHDDVLEHHASFDWEAAAKQRVTDDEGRDGLAKLRRAAENWDVPIVVTTAVQFFESLFANRTSRCRKLHNIADSVVILDEAQTLPVPLLLPCMAALDELARNYRTSIVLCTATQPALRQKDGFANGLAIDDGRELAPEPERLYRALKRVEVERLPGQVSDAEIAARFAAVSRMLCIVETRAHAQALFAAIRDLPGAVHLSTLMCPRHRRAVLERVRERLAAGEPVRVVSTSLIEAGVDISFPEVWRAATGIDAIAQAAGRCNREGELPGRGRVVVFEPAEATPLSQLKHNREAAEVVLAKQGDPLGIDAVRTYFNELYWVKGPHELDCAKVDGRPGILPAIRERADRGDFPFASIAAAFRLIEDIREPVIIPWQAGPDDDDACALLARIAAADRPRTDDLRRLQQYVVAIPRDARDEWLRRGVLRPVHPALDAILRFEDTEHYDQAIGVRLSAPLQRETATNVI